VQSQRLLLSMDKSVHGDPQFDNFYFAPHHLAARPGGKRPMRRASDSTEDNDEDPKLDDSVLAERATSLLECGAWDMDRAMQVGSDLCVHIGLLIRWWYSPSAL